ncbi:MAG: hypothetical protein WC373_13345 [Smithella sp.]|jgi:hypothetical protein
MTLAAWIMLIITWSIIVCFAVKFFLKVLKTPHALKTEEQIEEQMDEEQQ